MKSPELVGGFGFRFGFGILDWSLGGDVLPGHHRGGDDAVVLRDIHDLDAGRAAPALPDAPDAHADYLPVRGDHHQAIGGGGLFHGFRSPNIPHPHACGEDDLAVAAFGVDGLHAHAAALVDGVAGGPCQHAVAVLHDQQQPRVFGLVHLDKSPDFVGRPVLAGGGGRFASVVSIGGPFVLCGAVPHHAGEPHADYAGCGAAHGAGVVLVEVQRLAGGRHEEELVLALHQLGADEFVAVAEVECADAALVDVHELAEGGLLDYALAGGEEDRLGVVVYLEAVALGVAKGNHGEDALGGACGDVGAVGVLGALGDSGVEVEAVHERLAGGVEVGLGNLVDHPLEDAAIGSEEEELVVGRRGDDAQDLVLFLVLGALAALAAALLLLEAVERRALDVVAAGEGDDAGLVLDVVERVGAEVVEVLADFGAAGVAGAVFLLGVVHVGLDDVEDALGFGEDRLVFGDVLEELLVFLLDLVALEAGELAEAHVEDGGGLGVVEAEALEEAGLGLVVVLGGADDADDLVDVVDGDLEAFEDVDAILRLLEQEAGAARDDLDAVVDEALEEELQAHAARGAVVEGEHVRREVRLQLGEAEEVVEDHVGLGVGLDGHDDVHAHVALGEVLDVGDALDLVVLDEVAEVDEHLALVHAVGELGDYDLLAAVLLGDDLRLGANLEGGAAGGVHLADGGAAADDGAGGEVGALDDLQEVVDGALRVVDLELDGVAELGKVVRRDVGGHADGDAGGAVEEEVGDLRGQDDRLDLAAVVVGHHVHGVLVHVLAEVLGELAHADLGVAGGGGAVAVDVAEVAVAVDQAVAHGEGLGEADDGVVDGGVAVWVVLTHDLADDCSRLAVRLGVGDAHLAHRVNGAAVDGLHAVARVG